MCFTPTPWNQPASLFSPLAQGVGCNIRFSFSHTPHQISKVWISDMMPRGCITKRHFFVVASYHPSYLDPTVRTSLLLLRWQLTPNLLRGRAPSPPASVSPPHSTPKGYPPVAIAPPSREHPLYTGTEGGAKGCHMSHCACFLTKFSVCTSTEEWEEDGGRGLLRAATYPTKVEFGGRGGGDTPRKPKLAQNGA